jgi:hypothetical protein
MRVGKGADALLSICGATNVKIILRTGTAGATNLVCEARLRILTFFIFQKIYLRNRNFASISAERLFA